jgi:Tol biopolymer transport system component/DNA-binding winged helix-turn-helix (wHTH) protein
MTLQTAFTFRFADIEVSEPELRVIRSGEPLAIEPKAFRVLIYLLRHAGHLVSKEELVNAVWGDTAVTDNSLARAVAFLRRVLGDDPHTPRYIETVSTAGYCFICPLEAGPESVVVDPPALPDLTGAETTTLKASERGTQRRLWIAGASACLLVLATGFAWYLSRPLPTPHITEYARLTLDGKHKYPAGADSSRLYLNLGDAPWGAGFISLSGGDVTRIPFDIPDPSPNRPWVAAVSPDGTRLLVLGKVVAHMERELWNVESSGRSGHYLASTYPNGVTWSPDGKQVLYSNPHGDLFTVSSEGGEPRLFLPSPAGSGEILRTMNLSWSPDGARIRFVRYQKYWEISSSGTNLHRLLPDWNVSTPVCCGSWTPNGDFFLFLAGNTNSGIDPTGAQIWALDERKRWPRPSLAGPIQLTTGASFWSSPIVSRDGRKIFSKQTTVRGELVRYDAQAKRYDLILAGISAEFVAFSHDGKYVAYVTFPDGILWRARLDGTERIQLTGPPFSPKSAIWSPDGTRILFEDTSSGEFAIYAVSSQGGAPLRLIPDGPRPQVDPTWNPDGTQVAYCTDQRFLPNSKSLTMSETHILDLASHAVTTLPPFIDGFFSPRWSPNGRLIVGMTVSQAGLALFDLQTRQYRSLLKLPDKNPQSIGWNTWSRDGRYVYFETRDAIMRIPVTGGKPEKLIDLSEFQFTGWFANGWFGLDPQDIPILIRDRGTQEIYALTLERK